MIAQGTNRLSSAGLAAIRKAATTHGASRTGIFLVWTSMLGRCNNPRHRAYQNYGARGIRVCERWRKSFTNFISDMGPRPAGMSIERKDNDGPYSPDNCRWATWTEQARNKRTSVAVTAFGERRNVWDWADDPRCAVAAETLIARMRRGWDAESAIVTPSQRSKSCQ